MMSENSVINYGKNERVNNSTMTNALDNRNREGLCPKPKTAEATSGSRTARRQAINMMQQRNQQQM